LLEREDNVQVKQIITELEREIARLREARTLLAGGSGKKRGRPPGKATGKRRLSAEGRRRISEALKRRWALRRKAAGKPAKAA
jgi:hypothetical protein